MPTTGILLLRNMMWRLEMIRAMFSLKWLSLRFFTTGWELFIFQEFWMLLFLGSIVWTIDLILGNELGTRVVHFAFVVLYRRVMAGGLCASKKRLDGQTIVITGCNVGIGRETVRDLSWRGANIIMACRNTTQAEKVAAQLRDETGSEIEVMKLDLSSLKSIRAFAADLKAKHNTIHMLINNAGVMFCEYTKTEDGFEMQMGTNHLGHFLLTVLLLPLLTRGHPARIITLSSLGHAPGKIPFDDMNYNNGYDKNQAYFNSKLANILFTRHLAHKLKGTNVQVFAVHPGAVQSNLARHMSAGEWSSSWLTTLVLKTTAEGAQSTIYCALEATQQDPYYYSDCAPGFTVKAARDDEAAERLWKLSEKMVGL